MIIKTGRFGQLTIGDGDLLTLPQGLLGFPELTKYCLIDPSDETLILWLQSIEKPDLSFPVLEPKIFKPDYMARLSALELRELKLDHLNQAAVLTILTIPETIAEMTANLKAPVIINLKEKMAKQVVLQENDVSIKYAMFKELRMHLMTLSSQKRVSSMVRGESLPQPMPIESVPFSSMVRGLEK